MKLLETGGYGGEKEVDAMGLRGDENWAAPLD
jgi:hypothetical protein